MKKCPNCGNEAESKFCTECGTQMIEIQDIPAESAAKGTDSDSMTQEFEQFEGFQEFEIPSEPVPAPEEVKDSGNTQSFDNTQEFEDFQGFGKADSLQQSQNAETAKPSEPSNAASHTNVAPAQNNSAQNGAAPDPFNANTSTYTYAPSGNSTKDNFKKPNQENSAQQNYQQNQNNQQYSQQNQSYQTYQTYQPPQKQGVSHKTWFVVLFLIIFWPVGLYLMWSRKKFTKAARIIITIVIGLLVASNVCMTVIGSNSSNDDSSLDSGSSYTFDSNSDVSAKDTDTSSSATTGEQNALKKAHSYLDFMAFSYKGLVEQLEYEGFTNAEAIYAVDHCGADWNQQAAKKAKEYLDYSSFSRQGLIDQLEFEGFTPAQAVYGVDQTGL